MTMLTRGSTLAALAGFGFAASTASSAQAAPSASLIDNHWTQQGGTPSVDHSAWSAFLGQYVLPGGDGVNRVNYAAAKGAQGQLKGYIAALEATDPTTLTRDAAMAYWINLYNAKTVDLILDNFPVASIRDIGGGLGHQNTFGFWDGLNSVARDPA